MPPRQTCVVRSGGWLAELAVFCWRWGLGEGWGRAAVGGEIRGKRLDLTDRECLVQTVTTQKVMSGGQGWTGKSSARVGAGKVALSPGASRVALGPGVGRAALSPEAGRAALDSRMGRAALGPGAGRAALNSNPCSLWSTCLSGVGCAQGLPGPVLVCVHGIPGPGVAYVCDRLIEADATAGWRLIDCLCPADPCSLWSTCRSGVSSV